MKVDRDVSDTKKDIYKDISKQVERYRNLPKLRLKEDYPIIENSEKMNVSEGLMKQTIAESKSISRSTDRHFISKKHPRIYKSNARTPMYEDNNSKTIIRGYQNVDTGQYESLDQADDAYH